MLASSSALYDVVDAISRLASRATASQATSSAAAAFHGTTRECCCANHDGCRDHCCCGDEPTPRRPDAPRPSATDHLLCALGCQGGSSGGVAVAPSLDPAVVSTFTLVIPPRVHAAIEVLAPARVVALDGDSLDKVPIATA